MSGGILTKVISLSSLWPLRTPPAFLMVDFLPPPDLLSCPIPAHGLRMMRKKKNREEEGRYLLPKCQLKGISPLLKPFLFISGYFLSPIINFLLGYKKFSLVEFCLAVWNPLIWTHIWKKTLHPDKCLGFKRFTEQKEKDIRKKIKI